LAAVGAAGPRSAKFVHTALKPILEPDQSELQRDQLLAELESLDSSDAAAAWAQRALGAKNSLTAVDARRVEDAFQNKLLALRDHNALAAEALSVPSQSGAVPPPTGSHIAGPAVLQGKRTQSHDIAMAIKLAREL